MTRGSQLVVLVWGMVVLAAVVYLTVRGTSTSIVLALMAFLPRVQQLDGRPSGVREPKPNRRARG